MNYRTIAEQFSSIPLHDLIDCYSSGPKLLLTTLGKLQDLVILMEDQRKEQAKRLLAHPEFIFEELILIPKSDQIQFCSFCISNRIPKAGIYLDLARIIGVLDEVVCSVPYDVFSLLVFRKLISTDEVRSLKFTPQQPKTQKPKLIPDPRNHRRVLASPLMPFIESNISICATVQESKLAIDEFTTMCSGDTGLRRAMHLIYPELLDDDIEWVKAVFREPNFDPKKCHDLIDEAASAGAICCFKYMLINGIPTTNNTLSAAVRGQNMEIVQLLLENGHSFDSNCVEAAITSFNQGVLEYAFDKVETKLDKLLECAIESSNFQALFFLMDKAKPTVMLHRQIPSLPIYQFALSHFNLPRQLPSSQTQIMTDEADDLINCDTDSFRDIISNDSLNCFIKCARIYEPKYIKLIVSTKASKIANYIVEQKFDGVTISQMLPFGAPFVQKMIDLGYNVSETTLKASLGIDSHTVAELQIIDLLLPFFVDRTYLMNYAVQSNSTIVVEHFIKKGYQILEDTLIKLFSSEDITYIYRTSRLLFAYHTFTLNTINDALLVCPLSCDLITLLISQGGDINYHTDSKPPILVRTIKQNDSSFARQLLAMGAAPVSDAFYLAAKNCANDVVAELIAFGADVNAPNSRGQCAIDAAFSITVRNDSRLENKRALINMLISHGATGAATVSLVDTVKSKENNDLRFFLDSGMSPNTRDSDGMTPLGQAIMDSNIEAIEILLTANASLTEHLQVPKENVTLPLQYAILRNNRQAIEMLIREPNLVDICGQSALTCVLAVDLSPQERIDLLVFLLDHGADPNAGTMYKPLHSAIKIADRKCVELLIMKGADPNAQTLDGQTPLEALCAIPASSEKLLLFDYLRQNGADITKPGLLALACQNKEFEIAKIILSNGGNPNDSTKGTTALMCAVFEQKTDFVTDLANAGADMNMSSLHPSKKSSTFGLGMRTSQRLFLTRSTETTPLIKAVSESDTTMVSHLLAHGADPNIEINRQTALTIAVSSGQKAKEIIQILIAGGADPNAGSSLPLHLYLADCQSEMGMRNMQKSRLLDIEIVRLLLQNGSSPNQIDSNGRDALDYCSANPDSEVVSLLLDAGARCTTSNELLNVAIRQNNINTVRRLIAAGASCDQQDNGAVPLFQCLENSNIDIARELIAAGAKTNIIWPATSPDSLKTRPKFGDRQQVFKPSVFVGLPLLAVAAVRNNAEFVDLLVSAGADPNFEGTLPYAISYGAPLPMIAKLIDAGADVNFAFPIPPSRGTVVTSVIDLLLKRGIKPSLALCYACTIGDESSVTKLLKDGVDVNSRAPNGQLPLACSVSHLPIFNSLLAAGADPLPGDVLYEACRINDRQIVTKLLTLGASPNQPNMAGQYPLAICKKKDVIAPLARHGVDLSLCYKDCIAQCFKVDALFDQLIALGVDLTPHVMPTIFKMITKTKYFDLIGRLIEAGVDPNYRSQNGDTILSFICQMLSQWKSPILSTNMISKLNPLVQIMGRCGADPFANPSVNCWPVILLFDKDTIKSFAQNNDVNKIDNLGITPIGYCFNCKFPSLNIELLLENGADPAIETVSSKTIDKSFPLFDTDKKTLPIIICILQYSSDTFKLMLNKSPTTDHAGRSVRDVFAMVCAATLPRHGRANGLQSTNEKRSMVSNLLKIGSHLY